MSRAGGLELGQILDPHETGPAALAGAPSDHLAVRTARGLREEAPEGRRPAGPVQLGVPRFPLGIRRLVGVHLLAAQVLAELSGVEVKGHGSGSPRQWAA